MRKPNTKRRRDFLTRSVLLLLLFGAYIPVGFMPAAGTPFLLELCPDAAPSMPMPAHQHPGSPHHHADPLHHGGSHAHAGTCPFGSAPGAGPPTAVVVFSPLERLSGPLHIIPESTLIAGRVPRAHPARGPPSPA